MTKPTIMLVYTCAGLALGFLFGQLHTLKEVQKDDLLHLEGVYYNCKEVYPWNRL